MKNDYSTFVMNYRRFTHTSKSSDEAFKTADYYTPIWRCETESERWIRDNSWWLVTIGIAMLLLFIIYPTFEWIITK